MVDLTTDIINPQKSHCTCIDMYGDITIKHRVQNPRHVTKLLSIASTHAQIYQCKPRLNREYGISGLACMSREAPRFLALDRVFRQQQLTRSFSLPEGGSNLPLYLRSTCLCYPSPRRWPRIAVKGISRNNFRPVRFYRTPPILNLAFIVKYTYV